MGFEDLLASLGQEAFRQRDAVLAAAREEAGGILREAEARRGTTIRQARERAETDARAEASRILSQARLAARREAQAARADVVGEALHDLEERLRRLLSTAAYREILRGLLAECFAEAAAGDPTLVRCRPEDAAAVVELARALGREIAVEEAPLALGGVEAVFGAEGRFVCRNALAGRLERLRPRLLQEARRALFDEPREEVP